MDTDMFSQFWLNLFGAHSARETPVPIPNTAVKPRSGYNTWVSNLGKIARCRIIVKPSFTGWLFSYLAPGTVLFSEEENY
jgi:hypothetical protein